MAEREEEELLGEENKQHKILHVSDMGIMRDSAVLHESLVSEGPVKQVCYKMLKESKVY